MQQIKLSTEYPISLIGIGVGAGPFGILEDFEQNKVEGKFNNF